MLTKVKATGKRGMVCEANWFDLFSFITTFGGTAIADNKAVFDTDPKAMETISWLFDHFKAETITYGGSLPKGQGVDALFYGGQLATIQYGRWILPNLRKLKNVQYDIAPMPSEDGKTVMPVAVYTAAMSVQTGAKDKDASLQFLSRYVNADGQKARLSGGGNAVPSMAGLDDIVLEGGLPANAKYFTEVAAKGYAVPEVIARSAKVGDQLPDHDGLADQGRSRRQDLRHQDGGLHQRGWLGMATSATEVRPAVDTSPAGHKRALSSRHRKDTLLAYGFLAPQLVGLVVFMIGPLVFAVVLAFSNWDGFGTRSFAGFSNFAWVFTDPQMRISMVNTLWFTVLQVPGLLVSGFLAAFFMQKARR